MLKQSILIGSLALSINANAMFCPNNLNQIKLGDSLEQVLLACGTPLAQKEFKAEPNVPQEWTYYVRMNANMQGTIKMVIAFTGDKVVNMNVNGIGLTNTAICGRAITLNNTPKQIETACGKPANITKSDTDSKPANMTELKYQGASTETLLFQDGKLLSRK